MIWMSPTNGFDVQFSCLKNKEERGGGRGEEEMGYLDKSVCFERTFFHIYDGKFKIC